MKNKKGDKKQEEKVIYYSDELNDEFSGITRNTIEIDSDYKYIKKNIFWKIGEFFIYRIIMTPFAYLYCKIKFLHKFKNKKVLKQVKKTGYFVYANHTLTGADAFIPNVLNFPKKTFVIVNRDNVSVKGLKWFIEMNGGMPLPSTAGATKNFISALEKRVKKNPIQIYPEAHIWPFYTKIRPFISTSFRYPVKFDKPVFCFTNTFHERKFGKKPKVITYVDGPFYADKNLSVKEQEQQLRNKVFETMCERAKLSTYEYVKYIKKEENTND